MNTIFMNCKKSEAFDPHKILLNLTDKIKLKRCDKYVALSNLSMYYRWKIQKYHIKTINLKYQLQHGMKNLNSLIDHILYQIFKINSNIYQKSMKRRLLILQ